MVEESGDKENKTVYYTLELIRVQLQSGDASDEGEENQASRANCRWYN